MTRSPAWISANPDKAAEAMKFYESMRLMEDEIARLKARVQDLLEANNKYLDRARIAEDVQKGQSETIKKLLEELGLYKAAQPYLLTIGGDRIESDQHVGTLQPSYQRPEPPARVYHCTHCDQPLGKQHRQDCLMWMGPVQEPEAA